MASSPMDQLLHQARLVLRRKHYAYRTEQRYLAWIRRFMLFHTKRHPKHKPMRSPLKDNSSN